MTLEEIRMEFTLAKKKSITIPLIWLLIYLSIIPMQLSNHVLCIGTDGHVALEVSTDGRCTDAYGVDPEYVEPSITGTPQKEDHCGSCIDLAIFLPLNTEPYLVPAQDGLMPPGFVVSLTTHQTSDSTVLTHTPLLDIPLVVDPTLISLRTTTLLI
jgi:hypothetical protein